MPIRKIKAGLVLTKEVDEFIGEPGYIFYDVDTNGDLTLRLSDGLTPGGVNMSSGGSGTSGLNVIGDDSSGSLLNLASGTPDLKFTGTGGVTVSVDDDVVTIDGSGVSGSGGGTLSMFADDSTNMEIDLATQDLQVSGGNSITTSTSSTQTLTVSLDDNITINSISSTDSTSIQVNDGLNVSGTLSADTIDVNTLISSDSTGINIDEAKLFVNGSTVLTINTADEPTQTTSTADVDDVLINDGGIAKRIPLANIDISSFNNDAGFASGGVSGFSASTVNSFPVELGDSAARDYGDGEPGGVGTGTTENTDAFGVALGTTFDAMEPVGSVQTTDLGSEEAHVGA